MDGKLGLLGTLRSGQVQLAPVMSSSDDVASWQTSAAAEPSTSYSNSNLDVPGRLFAVHRLDTGVVCCATLHCTLQGGSYRQ